MGRRFFEHLERWEKRLQVFVVLLFSLLIVVQLLMTKDPIRFYLSYAEQMERIPVSGHNLVVTDHPGRQGPGSVKVEICGYFALPQAAIYVNGEQAANFQEREVLLSVRPGDEIVIDGTVYSYPIVFQVSETSEQVCWPQVNHQVTTDASRVSLGQVRFE